MKHIFALGLLSIALMQGMASALEAKTARNQVGSFDETIRIDEKTRTARDYFDQQQRNGS